jgi:hypothetical protein
LQGNRSDLHDSSEVGELRQGGGKVGLGVLEPQELYTQRDKELSNAIQRQRKDYLHARPKMLTVDIL